MDVLATSLAVPAPAPPPSPIGAVKVTPGFAALALLVGAAIPILLRNRRRLWAPALGISLVVVFGAASLFAHEGHDHEAQALAPPSGDCSAVLPDGRIFLPKPSQRILALRTGFSATKDHRQAVELPGRIIPDPNASGLVQASTAGRLSAPPGGFPRLGAQVKKGDVLAYMTVPFLAIDQPTLHQMAGDFEQQITILERRVARYEILIKSQAVAQTALDDARLELEGLRKRRIAVDRSKREPEALLAPVDGVIASTNAVAGQIADPTVIIFQIVDPRRLWVEAMAFDAKAFAATATARTADGKSFDLDFVGAGLADRNQSVPVDFAIRPDQAAGLRLGQFVTVSAQTSEHKTGIEAPRASVIRRSNGQNVVFEHVSAELFSAREVRVETLDGDRVLIVSGLEPGRRIVTQGAQLLDQVR
jgi:RND family efflux transporter MFP subunit